MSDRPRLPIQNITAGGWHLAVARQTKAAPDAAMAVCDLITVLPESSQQPGRGILLGLAVGSPGMPGSILDLLAEGSLAAPPTLGVPQAAARALMVANRWVCAQNGSASLIALLCTGTKLARLQVGIGQLWRQRDGRIEPLGAPNARRLGLDDALVIDQAKDIPQQGDRYIVLIGTTLPPDISPEEAIDHLAARLVVCTTDQAAIALVLDVLATPHTDAVDTANMLADLKSLASRPEPKPGEIWDGFRLERILYRGACTLLFVAQAQDGSRVVLKLPRPGILDDEVFRNGFIREAWVGASISSPYVARYLPQPPERQGSLYLVLPYYTGETLEERLLREPRLGLLEALRMMQQLCDAITDLAAHGVLHCDLKPENVLVNMSGNIVLLDLGLAFLPGRDGAAETRLSGTVAYMAPELFRRVAPNACTEVYALGAILYRMFTAGRFPPLHAGRALARLRPDLPQWLHTTIIATLSHTPSERPQDAAALAAQLEQGLRFGPAPTPPPSHSALSRWRSTAIVLAGMVVILLVLLISRP